MSQVGWSVAPPLVFCYNKFEVNYGKSKRKNGRKISDGENSKR